MKLSESNIVQAIQFFFLFFFPNIGKHLGLRVLGDSTDYFRKVFSNSMDNRSATKVKRGDIIDSLHQLKAEDARNEIYRE